MMWSILLVEEEVVAGTTDCNRIIVKSGVKPKLESITLSQWSIGNLAILYKLVGEGGKIAEPRDN